MTARKNSYAVACILVAIVVRAQSQNQTTQAANPELTQQASFDTNNFFFSLQSPLKVCTATVVSSHSILLRMDEAQLVKVKGTWFSRTSLNVIGPYSHPGGA